MSGKFVRNTITVNTEISGSSIQVTINFKIAGNKIHELKTV